MNCFTTLLSYIFRPSPTTPDITPTPPSPEQDESPEGEEDQQRLIPLVPLPLPRPPKHKCVRFGATALILPTRRLSSSSTSSRDENIILPHHRSNCRRSIMKPPTALDQEMLFRNTCRMVAVAEQRLEMSYHHILCGGGDLEAVIMEEESMLFDEARELAVLQGAMSRVRTLQKVGGRRRLRKRVQM